MKETNQQLMKIKTSPYAKLGKQEQASKLFLEVKKKSQTRTEEPGRRKNTKRENLDKEQ
jgi:hypothetical protein